MNCIKGAKYLSTVLYERVGTHRPTENANYLCSIIFLCIFRFYFRLFILFICFISLYF
jgi:hypothetical protein